MAMELGTLARVETTDNLYNIIALIPQFHLEHETKSPNFPLASPVITSDEAPHTHAITIQSPSLLASHNISSRAKRFPQTRTAYHPLRSFLLKAQ